jgi:superfamily I DNA/RNA helicase
MIKIEEWQLADGLVLEPNALKAVKEQKNNVALTAGPGAGKTELLAQRADFLLRTGLCPYPQRILAISFKVDASRNLKDRVRRRCGPRLASRFDSNTFHAFSKRLIDRFRPDLPDEDALDPDYAIGEARYGRSLITFAELVPFAVEILEHSDVARNSVRQTYSHVFLDEFQDCTNTQFTLIRAAFEGTDLLLTAVGDTKQRIMGWAGALEGIFSKFATRFGAIGLNLYQNFRSQPHLRRMQNAMIKVLEPRAAVEDGDIPGDAGEITMMSFDDSFQEAGALADLIGAWVREEQIPPAEIGVLMPRQVEDYAEHLISELQSRKIAFRNEQTLQDLSAEPIARLIVDFLLIVVGDREPDAYVRFMETLMLAGADEEESEKRSHLQQFIDDQRARMDSGPPLDSDSLRTAVQELLAELGPEAIASLSSEYEHGDYLKKMTDQTLERVIELWKLNADLLASLSRFSEDRAVRIMTIHKSKGLEFRSVVLLGVEKEAFWGKLADERSVFFVGISRAKHRLVLTSVHERPTPSRSPKYWSVKRTPQREFLGYADTP